jgi:UPF0271 protein
MSKEKTTYVDINCDLGEWDALDPHPEQQLRDREIMPFVSSVNIACGGHRGDGHSIRTTMEHAASLDLAIGLHPSFPDREGFGRVEKPWSDLVAESLYNQLDFGRSLAREVGVELHHIKPHGALYNMASKYESWAEKLWTLFRSWDDDILVYGLSESEMAKGLGLDIMSVDEGRSYERELGSSKSEAGPNLDEATRLKAVSGSEESNAFWAFDVKLGGGFCAEAFADRAYNPNLTLRSRSKDGAVYSDPSLVLAQVQEMVLHGQVRCVDGISRSLKVQSICLHSDTPGAVEMAELIARSLKELDIEVRPCS